MSLRRASSTRSRPGWRGPARGAVLILAALLIWTGPAGASSPSGGRARVASGTGGCPVGVDCTQPCFGARARDPLSQPCANPHLTYAVVPTPSVAAYDTSASCANKILTTTWWVCELGPLDATRTFGLVGDSHAGHWRAALGGVAYANRWRGISITRAGCQFSQASPYLLEPLRTQCLAWNRHVVRFFSAHPEVDIVFVSDHSGAGVVPRRGQSAFAAKVDGYIAAWAALPPSVKHIVVIRDVPLDRFATLGCVDRAIARHRPAGSDCAVPRRRALPPDPEVAAARRLGTGRVQVADLTPFFCDPRLCYPVVGGVLVHSDVNHLTTAFSTTLGPFLLRQLQALMASGAWS